jgi:hypothetical protein
MNQIIKSKGINFGLIFGLVLISPVLYAYAIDQTFFASFWNLGIALIAFFVHGFWVVGSLKKAQGGYASFKEAFSVFFIANAVGLLISVSMTILIFVVIDPELQNTVKELSISATTTLLENMGATTDVIDQSISDLRAQDNYSVGAQLKSYFYSLIFASIFGALISLILKKNKED